MTAQFLTGDGVSKNSDIPRLMILKDDQNQSLESDLVFSTNAKNPILFKVPQQN